MSRLHPLVLLVALACGLSLAPARAEDVGVRAADLARSVDTLRTAFADLTERVDALEEAFDREEAGALDEKPRRRATKPKPPPKAPEKGPGATPPPTGEAAEAVEPEATSDEGDEEPTGAPAIDPAVAELVGTWTIDMEAFLETMTVFLRQQLQEDLGDVPPEIVEGAIEAMREQLASVKFELVLAADLTFEATSTMGDEPSSVTGTWEREGENVTLHQTHEDGEPMAEPTDVEGVWDGSTLRLRPDEEVPVELLLVRVPADD